MGRISLGAKNDNHPELRDGEMLLRNTAGDGSSSGYKTRHLGEVAFNMHGKVVSGLRPVFVQKSEYDAVVLKNRGAVETHCRI